MVSNLLLDTDTCVAILRRVPQVVNRLARLLPEDHVSVSVITAAELFTGAHLSMRPESNVQIVRALLQRVQLLPLGEREAELFAAEKVRLRRAGQPVADNDLYIAATALADHLTLVTHNQAHFSRISGLLLDDWL